MMQLAFEAELPQDQQKGQTDYPYVCRNTSAALQLHPTTRNYTGKTI